MVADIRSSKNIFFVALLLGLWVTLHSLAFCFTPFSWDRQYQLPHTCDAFPHPCKRQLQHTLRNALENPSGVGELRIEDPTCSVFAVMVVTGFEEDLGSEEKILTAMEPINAKAMADPAWANEQLERVSAALSELTVQDDILLYGPPEMEHEWNRLVYVADALAVGDEAHLWVKEHVAFRREALREVLEEKDYEGIDTWRTDEWRKYIEGIDFRFV